MSIKYQPRSDLGDVWLGNISDGPTESSQPLHTADHTTYAGNLVSLLHIHAQAQLGNDFAGWLFVVHHPTHVPQSYSQNNGIPYQLSIGFVRPHSFSIMNETRMVQTLSINAPVAGEINDYFCQ
jgi:hypothetical protein